MSDELNSHTIIAIVTGLLLSISELLPFISKIESNGLLHFLVKQGNQLLNKGESEENEPLLPMYNKSEKQKRDQSDQSEKEKSDQSDQSEKEKSDRRQQKKIKRKVQEQYRESESDLETEHKILKRKRKMKGGESTKGTQGDGKIKEPFLKTSEEYELDFLKNYIITHYLDHIVILPSFHLCNREIFEKMGYKIFYDHIVDKYTLKW